MIQIWSPPVRQIPLAMLCMEKGRPCKACSDLSICICKINTKITLRLPVACTWSKASLQQGLSADFGKDARTKSNHAFEFHCMIHSRERVPAHILLDPILF
jgi:hypothetical protein